MSRMTRGTGRSRTDETSRERAVSDVVAFVLTFSIIIAGVGLVSVGGLDQLTTFTNNQQLENSDRGMEAAAASVDKLHRNSDTYREFDLSLGGGDIWFNSTSIGIESDDINLDELPGDHSGQGVDIPVNALEHRFELSQGQVNLAMESGAVFRTQSALPRYNPTITCGGGPAEDKTIISLVNMTVGENIDRSGAYQSDIVLQPTGVPEAAPVSADNQFVSIRAELVDQQRVLETDESDDIEIEIDVSETAYPEQWAFYFEDKGWGDAGNSDDHVYDCGGETVLVRITTIELSLLQRGP